MKQYNGSEQVYLLKMIMVFSVFISLSSMVWGQGVDYYEGKWNLGNPSTGWYKLATFDLDGNGIYNSIIIDAEVNYIRTGEYGYAASAKLFFREGATYNGKWHYKISGTQIGDFLKYKKINATTYELFAYSGGNYGHVSIRLAVTKEAPLIVSLPTSKILVPDPDIYTDVPKVGRSIFFMDKIGIGSASPDAKLTVKGDVHAEEVKVDLSVPGPDYVFKEGYNLKTLEEVQSYIKENGHLPNIPSAKEMEEKGIELGEMNMKLLEKIEELTLYIIELKRENEKYEHLSKKIKVIEEKLDNRD